MDKKNTILKAIYCIWEIINGQTRQDGAFELSIPCLDIRL